MRVVAGTSIAFILHCLALLRTPTWMLYMVAADVGLIVILFYAAWRWPKTASVTDTEIHLGRSRASRRLALADIKLIEVSSEQKISTFGRSKEPYDDHAVVLLADTTAWMFRFRYPLEVTRFLEVLAAHHPGIPSVHVERRRDALGNAPQPVPMVKVVSAGWRSEVDGSALLTSMLFGLWMMPAIVLGTAPFFGDRRPPTTTQPSVVAREIAPLVASAREKIGSPQSPEAATVMTYMDTCESPIDYLRPDPRYIQISVHATQPSTDDAAGSKRWETAVTRALGEDSIYGLIFRDSLTVYIHSYSPDKRDVRIETECMIAQPDRTR